MQFRASYLEVEEAEPLLAKRADDVEEEFKLEEVERYMATIKTELDLMEKVKSEEVQKARAKERSNLHWTTVRKNFYENSARLFKMHS